MTAGLQAYLASDMVAGLRDGVTLQEMYAAIAVAREYVYVRHGLLSPLAMEVHSVTPCARGWEVRLVEVYRGQRHSLPPILVGFSGFVLAEVVVH